MRNPFETRSYVVIAATVEVCIADHQRAHLKRDQVVVFIDRKLDVKRVMTDTVLDLVGRTHQSAPALRQLIDDGHRGQPGNEQFHTRFI
jgi:hypothetical protein